MMEEVDTGLGRIRIHKRVIAQIVNNEIEHIEGVAYIFKRPWANFKELFSPGSAVGIKVTIDPQEQLSLRIPLVIKYGYNMANVASQVQEKVGKAIGGYTDMLLKEINVDIKGINRR